MIDPIISQSIIGRARERGFVRINAVNLRNYTYDKHHTTDDAPYGGGPGMVMKCEPLFQAVEDLTSHISGPKPRVILMTPRGRRFDQNMAEELVKENHIILICGRYEGLDERICEHLVTDEVSIGDYVITGGELAALTITDAVCRLVPGVLGDEESNVGESFSSGLLEYPQYTRPADFRGWTVPDVLLSGDHARINKWRRQMALKKTFEQRPDLLETAELSVQDIQYLESLRKLKEN